MKLATFVSLALTFAVAPLIQATDTQSSPASLRLTPDSRPLPALQSLGGGGTPVVSAKPSFTDTYYINDHLSTTVGRAGALGPRMKNICRLGPGLLLAWQEENKM